MLHNLISFAPTPLCLTTDSRASAYRESTTRPRFFLEVESMVSHCSPRHTTAIVRDPHTSARTNKSRRCGIVGGDAGR